MSSTYSHNVKVLFHVENWKKIFHGKKPYKLRPPNTTVHAPAAIETCHRPTCTYFFIKISYTKLGHMRVNRLSTCIQSNVRRCLVTALRSICDNKSRGLHMFKEMVTCLLITGVDAEEMFGGMGMMRLF